MVLNEGKEITRVLQRAHFTLVVREAFQEVRLDLRLDGEDGRDLGEGESGVPSGALEPGIQGEEAWYKKRPDS